MLVSFDLKEQVKLEEDPQARIARNNWKKGPFRIQKTQGKKDQLFNTAGHWKPKEKLKYVIFLQKFQQRFEVKENRRAQKVFKAMANFLGSRNPNQCRSHHQKMEKSYGSVGQIIHHFKGRFPEYNQKMMRYTPQLSKTQFSKAQMAKNSGQGHENSIRQEEQLSPVEESIRQYQCPLSEQQDQLENVQLIQKLAEKKYMNDQANWKTQADAEAAPQAKIELGKTNEGEGAMHPETNPNHNQKENSTLRDQPISSYRPSFRYSQSMYPTRECNPYYMYPGTSQQDQHFTKPNYRHSQVPKMSRSQADWPQAEFSQGKGLEAQWKECHYFFMQYFVRLCKVLNKEKSNTCP